MSEQTLHKCIWYFIIEVLLLVQCTNQTLYSRIHATNSPASGAGNVQADVTCRGMREVKCA